MRLEMRLSLRIGVYRLFLLTVRFANDDIGTDDYNANTIADSNTMWRQLSSDTRRWNAASCW